MYEFGSRTGMPYMVGFGSTPHRSSRLAQWFVLFHLGRKKTFDSGLRCVAPAHGRAYSVTIGKLAPRASSKDGASLKVVYAKHAKHGGGESMMTALL